jgi:hypothetical protein
LKNGAKSHFENYSWEENDLPLKTWGGIHETSYDNLTIILTIGGTYTTKVIL